MKPLRPLFFLLWFWLGSSGSAQLAQHAVVLIPSHGGSGVVIHTQRDRTWILSAAHLFKGKKPIRIEVPMAKVANPKKVGVFLIARDARRDLALVELRFGPLPYVAPVSERGTTLTRGQWLLSVGYDRLRKPAQMQWTRLQSISGGVTYTTKPPLHCWT